MSEQEKLPELKEAKEQTTYFPDNLGFLDNVISKLTSRKLLVWLSGLVFFGFGRLESEHFVWISLVYIGSEGLADIVARVKHAPGS